MTVDSAFGMARGAGDAAARIDLEELQPRIRARVGAQQDLAHELGSILENQLGRLGYWTTYLPLPSKATATASPGSLSVVACVSQQLPATPLMVALDHLEALVSRREILNGLRIFGARRCSGGERPRIAGGDDGGAFAVGRNGNVERTCRATQPHRVGRAVALRDAPAREFGDEGVGYRASTVTAVVSTEAGPENGAGRRLMHTTTSPFGLVTARNANVEGPTRPEKFVGFAIWSLPRCQSRRRSAAPSCESG